MLSLAPARFIHFGTTRELLKLVSEDIEDYSFLGWEKQVFSSSKSKCACSNSVIEDTAFADESSYIEDSYIMGSSKIGKNCVLFHQVTIGSNTLPGSSGQGFPTLGDNVYIGCGAKIIGNVKVGNNVRIGANCVVTRDVPDNATVVLEKPRVILREAPQENRFVSFEEMTGK